jgi:hypothetical protein
MGCPHELAERVKELEPVFVGAEDDAPIAVDIYFCDDCMTDFACMADTFQIISHLSMQDEPADEASDAGNEVYDGCF